MRKETKDMGTIRNVGKVKEVKEEKRRKKKGEGTYGDVVAWKNSLAVGIATLV